MSKQATIKFTCDLCGREKEQRERIMETDTRNTAISNFVTIAFTVPKGWCELGDIQKRKHVCDVCLASLAGQALAQFAEQTV